MDQPFLLYGQFIAKSCSGEYEMLVILSGSKSLQKYSVTLLLSRISGQKGVEHEGIGPTLHLIE